MVRDPRDVIVSGYFYHLWTSEKWAKIPRDEFGGISYQEYLIGLSKEDGISAEMIRFSKYDLPHFVNWNYDDDNILELKYEDVIVDENNMFRKLFKHYGFRPAAVERSLKIVEEFSFQNVSGRKIGELKVGNHLRFGNSGQWREHFDAVHIDMATGILSDALILLGYESSKSW